MHRLTLALLTLALPITAQEPVFRGSIGFSGGSYGFTSDLPEFDDSADADMFLARFEATTAGGYGGGFRFESLTSDDTNGLFREPLNSNNPNGPLTAGTKARNDTFQAHFTYLVRQHRFEMPVRAGLILNGLVLDEQTATTPESDYVSFGPYIEIEPEVTLLLRETVRWSAYGQFGFGVARTDIDIDGDPRDYSSDTSFANIELGMRVLLGPAEISVAYVGRFQSMDQSSIESGQFVYGFESDYQGLLLTAGVRF